MFITQSSIIPPPPYVGQMSITSYPMEELCVDKAEWASIRILYCVYMFCVLVSIFFCIFLMHEFGK